MKTTQWEWKPTAAGMKTCSGRMFWLDYSMDDVTNSMVEQYSCNNFHNSYFNTNSSALLGLISIPLANSPSNPASCSWSMTRAMLDNSAVCPKTEHANYPLIDSKILWTQPTTSMGYGLPWYGLAPSFNSIEMGGRFHLPRVPSKSDSYLSGSESSFSWCDGSRWEQSFLTMVGRFTLPYLASSISMTLLVALQVLTGSWARQVFCHSILVMLGLSCKLTIFLMGKRILSMVMIFSLKSRTAPILCKVYLPMIRSYKDALAPALNSTISGVSQTDLLAEYSTEARLISPTFLVWNVPLKVPCDCGTALLTVGMYLLDPFLMKRRSPLDPVSSSTLIVLV